MNGKTTAVAIFALLMLVLVSGTQCAVSRHIDIVTGYSATDEISKVEIWNEYHVAARGGYKITYDVKVIGDGNVKVLFYTSAHDLSGSSKYLVSYSADSDTKEYSNVYYAEASGLHNFTICVNTENDYSVKYHISITVTEGTPVNWLLIGLLVLAVPIALIAGYIVWDHRRDMRKAEMQSGGKSGKKRGSAGKNRDYDDSDDDDEEDGHDDILVKKKGGRNR